MCNVFVCIILGSEKYKRTNIAVNKKKIIFFFAIAFFKTTNTREFLKRVGDAPLKCVRMRPNDEKQNKIFFNPIILLCKPFPSTKNEIPEINRWKFVFKAASDDPQKKVVIFF